jgi:uncharacterized YigZ family protein
VSRDSYSDDNVASTKIFRPILPAEVELGKIKGSRFIANLAPVSSLGAAAEFLASVSLLHPSASHHCYAWRLASGESRSSDDGEPRGSAGPPILRRLESCPGIHGERAEIVDAAIVVTRYFGGTKLGIGGLIRSYGAAAAEVLSTAKLEQARKLSVVSFRHSYADSGLVRGVLASSQAEDVEREFGEDVLVSLTLPSVDAEAFRLRLVEACSGRIIWP